jgi:hypothetical protein
MQQPRKPFSESGSSPPLTVTLSSIDLVPGCTVGTGVGLDAEGNEVTFACDWRPARALAKALAAGEVVEVTLEAWQIIGRKLS